MPFGARSSTELSRLHPLARFGRIRQRAYVVLSGVRSLLAVAPGHLPAVGTRPRALRLWPRAGLRPSLLRPAPPRQPAAGQPVSRPLGPPLVTLRGVSRRYQGVGGGVLALAAVDLELYAGEFVVVLGPSGSGKTTLLNLIGALDGPTSGEIVVAGHRLSGAKAGTLNRYRRETVSFIFQTFNLFPGLTALENVQFGADIAGRRRAEAVAAETLGQVGLGDRLSHFPHALSGGEQQRVAIARALATGNPVLLADEPTGELDVRTGVQILELLRAQAGGRRLVVVVTHNREIARVADRVVELSSGRVVSNAPPPEPRPALGDLRW